MNVFAVRLNYDPREGAKYTTFPSMNEYSDIAASASMNGFHECVNFMPLEGMVKGYLPPQHSTKMRDGKPFALVSITAKGESIGGDKIYGLQVGCQHCGDQQIRHNVPKSIKGLQLNYHYTCPASLSLSFNPPLEDARKLLDVTDWIRKPTKQLSSIAVVKRLLQLGLENKSFKKSDPCYKAIVSYLESNKGKAVEKISPLDEEQSKFQQEVDSLQASPIGSAKGNEHPRQKEVRTYIYERDAKVVAFALQRSKGRCEACGKKAPFVKASNGQPYLEVHHIESLSVGGKDTPDNVLALCPNCHREKHFG